MSFFETIEEKFSKSVLAVLRQFSTHIGLQIAKAEPDRLVLKAVASLPGRSIGLYIVLISLLPFYSDLLVEPGNTSPSNGYDFFNHIAAIPLRLCLTLPGLWIWLVHAKVVRCKLDKISNTLLVEHKSYLTKQTAQCLLEEIFDLEVTEVEKSIPHFLEGDRLTHIQVSFLRHSKEPISFTFIESSGGIDANIIQTYNRLSEFLSLA